MSLVKGLVIVGLVVGGYLLYTKFASQKQAPQVSSQSNTQLANNAIQVTNLGLDPAKGVGSVVLSAIGDSSTSDAAIKEFVSTHDYGAFTRAVLNENAAQKAQEQPIFTTRSAATAWAKSH